MAILLLDTIKHILRSLLAECPIFLPQTNWGLLDRFSYRWTNMTMVLGTACEYHIYSNERQGILLKFGPYM